MPNRSESIILEENNKQKCNFCGTDDIDPDSYGPLYLLEDVVAHYYCVLLSHKMRQRGKDEQGILGFLLIDIRAELKRASKIKCVFCFKYYASLQCSNAKCKIKFHLPCGLKAGSMHQFMKQFLSFCPEHRPKQQIPQKALLEAENHNPICSICQESVDFRSVTETLWAPCCTKTWYHRLCVQRLANSAGYFFKCAICNNTDKFKNCMQQFGIFIPEQDASWELEPNAFQELLYRHSECNADECKCPNGRTYDVDNTRWEIVLCKSCGSEGIHVACGKLKFHNPSWECGGCGKFPGHVVESSSTASSASSVSSISSSSSEGFEIGNRGRKNRSKSLENKLNKGKRYRLRRGNLQSRKRSQARENLSKDESLSDSSSEDNFLNLSCSRRGEEAPPINKESSLPARSSFTRSDPKRRSAPPVSKRKRKVDEGNEDEEKAKLDRRKKRRSVRDENLNPEVKDNVQDSKAKDGAESSSNKSSDSDNSKESSELEKEENPKDEKNDKKSSNDFSEALTTIKPRPLRFKLAALQKAGGDKTGEASTSHLGDDEIQILPQPVKKALVIDLSDTDEKPETDVEIEEVEAHINPMSLMYRVKKEPPENESEEEIVVTEEEGTESSDKELTDLPPNQDLLKDIHGSGAKVIATKGLLVIKSEIEIEELETLPEEIEKEKEIEKAVEAIVNEMKVKESMKEKAKSPVVTKNVAEEKVKEPVKEVEKKVEEKVVENKNSKDEKLGEEKISKPEVVNSLKTIQQPANEKWVEFEGKIYSAKKTENGILLQQVTDGTENASQAPKRPQTETRNVPVVTSISTGQVVQNAPVASNVQMPGAVPVANTVQSPLISPTGRSLNISSQIAAIQGSVPAPNIPTAQITQALRHSNPVPVNYQNVNNPLRNPQTVPYTPPRPNPPNYQYSQPQSMARPQSMATAPMNYNNPYPQQNVLVSGYVQFPAPRSTRQTTSTYVPPHSASTTHPSTSFQVQSSPVPQAPTSNYPISSSSYLPGNQQIYVNTSCSQSNYVNTSQSYVNTSQYGNYSQPSMVQPSTSTYVPSNNPQSSLPFLPEYQVVGALKPISTQEYVLSPSVPPTTATYRPQPPPYSAPNYSAPQSAAYSAPNYSAPQSAAYSAPNYSAPQSAAYSAPQSSYTTTTNTPTQSANFNPLIVDVQSLAKDNINYNQSPRKSPFSSQTAQARKTPRKQSFPQIRPTTPPRLQSPNQQQGIRMPQPKPVATIPPTQTPRKPPAQVSRNLTNEQIRSPPIDTPKSPTNLRNRKTPTPEKNPKSNDNDDIMIIDEKKPPIPPLQPIPELLNINRQKGSARASRKNDCDADVIQLD